jgi:pyruvate dehydrogenase E1 component
VVATLERLARSGEVKPEAPREAFDRYQLDSVTAAGHGTIGGDA